jgi:hypothetical protein
MNTEQVVAKGRRIYNEAQEQQVGYINIRQDCLLVYVPLTLWYVNPE